MNEHLPNDTNDDRTTERFVRLTGGESLTLEAATSQVARTRILKFTQRVFQEHYQAEIGDDSPCLIGAFDRDHNLVAALGLRDASSGFFCEHYLDQSVAEALSTHYGMAVPAELIIEVTHLCARRPGFLRDLIALLPEALMLRGYRYLTCTATRCLEMYFRRRGLPCATLGPATREALPAAERSRWGSYYDAQPRVLAGELMASGILGRLALQPAGS